MCIRQKKAYFWLCTLTTAWLFGCACCRAGASLASNNIMTGIMLLLLPVLTLRLDQHRTLAHTHTPSATLKINLASTSALPLLDQSSWTLNTSQGMYACSIPTLLNVTHRSLLVVPIDCMHSLCVYSVLPPCITVIRMWPF